MAAQLVGAGIGIGVFPARMVEACGFGGAIFPLATRPGVPAGRLYVADRAGSDGSRTEAIVRTVTSLTLELRYFKDV